ncbi:hypothetical protein HSBAA_43820 [Vreelandella sulfidaeris]|uniref:NADH-Ubiquinone oxidoreductase (complex I) chain 5 N-terminal domain-containing protein n=1 Tax=Vreelandella sulfidaeris TaxID=115553 RepID=A0A455UA69_9GAMM|nr:hypothetical protein HSBAA_43820 [Halomonas sulfidaeris]
MPGIHLDLKGEPFVILEVSLDTVRRVNGLRTGRIVACVEPLVWPAYQPFLALFPAALTVWLLLQAPEVLENGRLLFEWQWVPSLGISLSFLLDGLSLLFGLLITVMGACVLVYAGGYLKNHPDLPRFHFALVAFMVSMLGLVLADGLFTLFIFWELTSITSYLLIGFNHADINARKSARQGLFVTVAGGLALMAGLLLLGIASGSWSLADILSQEADLREHALYTLC